MKTSLLLPLKREVSIALCIVLAVTSLNKSYSQNPWVRKTDFGGVARAGASTLVIGNRLYVGAGVTNGAVRTDDFWEYNPATNTWLQKASYGGGGVVGQFSFEINGKGYVGTGMKNGGTLSYASDFWQYDPSTNRWSRKTDFAGSHSTGRHLATGLAINGKGYVGCGFSNLGYALKDFYQYDDITNTWSRKADFPGSSRDEAKAFTINGKGYMGTGHRSNDKYADFYEYDPNLNTWSRKADFPAGGRRQAVAFAINGKGYMGMGYQAGNDIWEFDPLSNTWREKARYPGSGRYALANGSTSTNGYIGLGNSIAGVYHKDYWEYKPECDFKPTTVSPTAICQGVNAQFSIVGLPSNVTTTWTASGNLTPQSGTGTTANVSLVPGASGGASVTFTFSGPCGTSSMTATSTVTAPAYPVADNSNFGSLAPNGINPVCFTTAPFYQIVGARSSNTGIFTVGYSGGNCMQLYGKSVGSAVLTLDVQGSCGTLHTYTYGVYVESGGGGCVGCPVETMPSDILIYPNPASSVVNVSLPGSMNIPNGTHLKLYNNYSKLVKTLAVRGAVNTINVADLPEGLYTLHLNTRNSTLQWRIQISR
jgi:N-acetylneuraminic acid mutarotase